jgi:hypothetical protein
MINTYISERIDPVKRIMRKFAPSNFKEKR